MTPLYPGQKLRSVSLETYFPGSFAFAHRFPELQKNFSNDFPNLFVPNVIDGEPLALRAFQIRNNDASRAIAFAINQCTYVAIGQSYPGYEPFKNEASKILDKAFESCDIENFTKITYRYQNVLRIHRSKSDDPLALDKVIAFGGAKWFYGGGLINLDLRWSQAWKDKGSLSFEISEKAGELYFEIAATVDDVASDDREVAINEAHEKAIGTFEDMITPEYRDMISTAEEE